MEEKKYSLKPIETQVLATHREQLNTMMSNVMSMIAMERLAYPVTDKTIFKFSSDMTEVTISEYQAPEEAGVVTEAPKKGKK